MKRTDILIILAAAALGMGCKQVEEQAISLSSDDECVVVGNIKGLKNGSVVLQDEYDGYKVIAEGTAKKGRFIIRTEVSQPTYVFLYSGRGEQLRDFFLEPGIISVVGDDVDEDYGDGATGTPSNDYIQTFRKERKLVADSELAPLVQRYYDNAPTDIVRLNLIDDFRIWPSKQKIELINALDPTVFSMPGVASMLELFTRRANVEPDGENFYVDIEQADPEGNIISLKEIVEKPGNKYVLVDFWATWCSPCREEMPIVKDAYARYHDKGFDIYAVSLDNGSRLKIWRKYIVENELPWTNVDSDEYTSTKAYKDYAIQGIPDNVLIDCSDGRIVGRTLRGENLAAKLAELLD